MRGRQRKACAVTGPLQQRRERGNLRLPLPRDCEKLVTKPTDIRTPNAETIEALRQARDKRDLTEYATLEDLKAALD